ncbi:hypothetical protein I203_103204 [Kwoniella mangroviensis CBS 8507]|uniref:uncharacterized protein n=1 Tax=Kwoniella mangroviensis CBS 8507 TaxID=1296122 RepID=UPI00302533BB
MSTFQDLKKSRTARQGISRPQPSSSSTLNGANGPTPDCVDDELASKAREVLSNALGRPLGQDEPGLEYLNDPEVEITNVSSYYSQGRKQEVSRGIGHPKDQGKGKGKQPQMSKYTVTKEGKDEVSHELYKSELEGSGLEVHALPGRGRGLITKRLIKAGTIILKTPPSISALQNQHFQRVCHGCYLTMKERNIASCKNEKERYEKKMRGELKIKLNRCSGCKVLHYCSRECQLFDWPTHKHECIALQRFRKMYYRTYPNKRQDDDDLSWTQASPEPVRALARIIWRRRVEREKNGGKDGIWWKQIASLESHVSLSTRQEVMRLAQQAQHLQHYLSASIPTKGSDEDEDQLLPVNMEDFGFENVQEVMNFCSSFHVNSFTLSSPSLTPIGVSNSPLMALSNHSCDPNAIVVFPNGAKYMELIAIKDIQIDQEILTSYIDLSCPYDIRQRDLKERYGFQCDCTLCEKSKDQAADWVDPRWCVRHEGCKCGDGKGKMPVTGSKRVVSVKCDKCKEDFKVNAEEVLSVVQKGVDVLDSDEHRQLDYKTAQRTLSTLIPNLQKHLPNHSYPLLSLLRLSSVSHTPPQSPKDLQIALKHIKQAYEACYEVYNQNHATPTLILCEYAKLLSLKDSEQPKAIDLNGKKGTEMKNTIIRNLLKAIEMLTKAVKQSEITFGKGSVVGKELEGILEGCKEEMERLKRS